MELKYCHKDTVEWMLSDDWKVRLKAEYWQLVIRLEGLRRAIVFSEKDFISAHLQNKSSYTELKLSDFREQFRIMAQYKTILEKRAEMNNIDLDSDSVRYLYEVS